jgi:peptidoglycan/xylan/chitin deacetylase (PgdA/CDA1 family)
MKNTWGPMLIKNFLFHRVGYDKDKLWPPMKPELFQKIIGYITSKYTVVNLEHFLQDPTAFAKQKKPLSTILFDDGYKDNIEYAAPILEEHACLASFYVVTDCINRNIPTWTYIVDYAVQYTKRKNLQFHFDYVPAALQHLSLAHKQDEIKKLKPWMKTLSNYRRKEIMESLLQQCDVSVPGNLMMNWREIQQLSSSGFSVGSHSHTHPMLAKLESEAEIVEELLLSKQEIQKNAGIDPQTISYPIGSFDERVIRLSKEAGYRYGLAVEQKFFNTGKDNLYAIPRVELYEEQWWKAKARITGVYQSVKKLWV